MKNSKSIISHNAIDNKIIELRDSFVIIDRDVAELYGVETKRVNEAVSNNLDKFPKDYMFELSKDEKSKVVEHFDHLSPIKYSPYLPKAFTKKGLWMLATILSSKQAKRPHYSLLNKSKIKKEFGIIIPFWKDSLDECLRTMGEMR